MLAAQMERRTIHQTWFFITLGVITLAFVWLTLDFIQPVFWAAVLAILFHPLQYSLDRLCAPRRSLAALISLAAIVLVVFVPLVLTGVAVSQEALTLYGRIKQGDFDLAAFLQRVDPIVKEITGRLGMDGVSLEQRTVDMVGATAQLVASQAVVVGQNVVSVVAKTGLMFYVLFFFLRDGEAVLATVAEAIPMGEERQRTLFARFTSVTRATLKGTLVVGAAQGLVGGLLFWVVGIRAPAFWGLIMGVLSIVPLLGPALIWVPVGVLLLAAGNIGQGIVVLAGGSLVVGTVDNILRPILVGRETRMPDYMVLLSTLGGLSAFGVSGFVAGPVLAALFLSAWDMFAREQRAAADTAVPVPADSSRQAEE